MKTTVAMLIIFLIVGEGGLLSGRSVREGTGSRIYHGDLAKEGQFPWAARFMVNLGEIGVSFCTSSLITVNYVVTAGHCVFNNQTGELYPVEDMLGQIGNIDSDEGQRIKYKQFWLHPEYNRYTVVNDIAILQTTEPVALKVPSTKTICLTSSNFQVESTSNVTAAGWGDNDLDEMDSLLRTAEYRLLPTSLCRMAHGSETQICVGSDSLHQPCAGDSGGPLMAKFEGKDVLIGVASESSGATCETGAFFSYYTLVTLYEKWIREVVKDESLCFLP